MWVLYQVPKCRCYTDYAVYQVLHSCVVTMLWGS